MASKFASVGDTEEKTISFDEIGAGCFAFTAQGDPNTGVIVGDDAVMIIDAQPTPVMASRVIEAVGKITDKPIKYVALTHYHAARTLGARAYGANEIISSDLTRDLIGARGKQNRVSEKGRFPRLFKGADSSSDLTWPTQTFATSMTVWLGKREVRLMHLGRGHTMGDSVVWVADAGVMFCGDLVAHGAACYCGDAHFKDWPSTLDRIGLFAPKVVVPGRGPARKGADKIGRGIEGTRDYLQTLYGAVSAAVEAKQDLPQAMLAARAVMDEKFGGLVLYDHFMAFNVARAFDEASGRDYPQIWTPERDREIWAALADIKVSAPEPDQKPDDTQTADGDQRVSD